MTRAQAVAANVASRGLFDAIHFPELSL